MTSTPKLWVAGSSPAGGATQQVNDMLTLDTRTESGRGTFYGPQSDESPAAEQTAAEAKHVGATACSNCGRYIALVANRDGGGPLLTFDYERDGYTPSQRRHACGEIDRNAYGPAGWSA